MGRIRNHGIEAAQYVDPQTGAEIVQLTNNPTISAHFYFENTQFTPDSKRVIFGSRRDSRRGAPNDLYRCDVDGRNLVQLSDRDDMGGACLSLDGTRVYITAGKEIIAVDMADGREEVVWRFDEAASVGNPSAGGKWVFARVQLEPGASAVVRAAIDGSEGVIIRKGKSVGHINASRTGNWVAWLDTAEINEYDTQTWYVMRADGSDNHRWAVQNWAHSGWVGDLDRMQGTLLPPGHGIAWVSPDETEPRTITSGPYFWHSAASHDGEWVVSDTNWPDIGLQLVHVPSGRFGTLCLSLASNSNHPNHPHPTFSPDGRKVLYTSDRTGVTQVYVATVPDWLRDELATGNLLIRHKVGTRKL